MSNTISENLAFYRRKRNLTQKELAEKTGLSISFISHIENKVSEPSDENLKKIADALGVSVSDLRVDENLKKLKNENIELIKLLTKLTRDLKIKWECNNNGYGDYYISEINNNTYNLSYGFNIGGEIDYIKLEIISDNLRNPVIIDSQNDNNEYNYLFNLINEIKTLEHDNSPVFSFLKDLEELDNQDE